MIEIAAGIRHDQTVYIEAGGAVFGILDLLIDDNRADDQRDRTRKLQNDQDLPRGCRRSAGLKPLQNLHRPEGREVKRRPASGQKTRQQHIGQHNAPEGRARPGYRDHTRRQ